MLVTWAAESQYPYLIFVDCHFDPEAENRWYVQSSAWLQVHNSNPIQIFFFLSQICSSGLCKAWADCHRRLFQNYLVIQTSSKTLIGWKEFEVPGTSVPWSIKPLFAKVGSMCVVAMSGVCAHTSQGRSAESATANKPSQNLYIVKMNRYLFKKNLGVGSW